MKPYYQDEWVTQYCNDALMVLPNLQDESIDLLCTDPPYGIGFMGKDWDKALPDKRIWAECFRVLKDGAFAFVMSIPRSDCLSRMIISLEDAGFWVNFTPIFWAYASGFPKAQNIGKAVDKRRIGGKFKEIRDYLRQCYKGRGKTQKQLAYAMGDFTTGGGRISHYLGQEQPLVPNWADWCILKNELSMDDRYDYYIQEFEREMLGVARVRETSQWCRTSRDNNTYITEPQTVEAKALDGSYGGFQPKPAVEVIIVCMKPLSEKTFVDQALKNRKGITWLDSCRIPYESEDSIIAKNPHTHRENSKLYTEIYGEYQPSSYELPTGRFPANLLVSDDVLNDGRKHKSGSGIKNSQKYATCFSGLNDDYNGKIDYPADSGSFSRYFDLDKWAQKTFPFLIVPKASKSEKNRGLDTPYGEPPASARSKPGKGRQSPLGKPRRNYHPTVKPLKLMSYLITLGSREGDTILDPFGGSGTTALASKLLGRYCIISEIKEKYCEIAAQRCSQGVFTLNI